MKILAYTHSALFYNVAKLTCLELDYSLITSFQKESLDIYLRNQDINLVLIDCDTFRPENFNILEYIQSISKKTYCLVVETTIHEIDKDALLAQISKQCLLQEIYFFQQFVKIFYNNYWKESEKKISQQINNSTPSQQSQIETKINYDELFSIDDNGIAIIKEKSSDYFSNSIELGFGFKINDEEQSDYMGLEPVTIKIYKFLKNNLNKPISINTLCNYTWGECNISKRNAIYVYIRKIRIYIGDNLDCPTKLIKCNKGFYVLKQG